MRAIRIEAVGGPEVMKLVEMPTPAPGSGQALVRVEAAGVNFIDIYQRSGIYKLPLPFTPGQEGAGVVEAVGDGVREVRAGDRVAWAGPIGSYATHVLIAAARLVPLPRGLDSRSAAAVMLQGMTAHYLVTDTFPLRPGHMCLIHAAAGGVGQLFCQLASRAGAHVIGTAGGPEKTRLAKQAGAHETIDYRTQDFEAEVKRITSGAGVHVVYDSVGKDTWEKSLRCLRPRGMLVLFGQSSGNVPPFDPQLLSAGGSLFLTRPTLGSYVLTRDELLNRAGAVLGAVERGELKLSIEETLPLANAAKAHELLASRKTSGKLLLLP
ncbi:MAG TPA: quinone oxidoreductase [Myxococcales bacterium]|nr:quinone oxidoreductase [Myxococcales bacterium]